MDPTDFPPLWLSILPYFLKNIPSREMDTGRPWARSMQPYLTAELAMFTSLTPVLTNLFGLSSDILYLS